ncbi:Putative Zn-dependent protease, contains TPR repeats [Marinomonas polaris DSM 16579]|uniref:Putative Zn-dependent protease, contains TPR repeats n=1 Tax=Marinomonas polaris DSM 16579 TaxID=1122206 RepID=A0A1M5A2E0_9GAMM|nr:M48 family metalloprotease [Marinomonas polaris]SHF24448.1 Putative Zn-dependent protease, contains TPR repeats [Marinomonas polaris DSM 16579]
MRLFSNVTTGLTILAVVFTSTLSNISTASIPDLEANKDERALSNPSYILGQYWFRKLNGSRALIDFPPAYDYLKDALSQILPQTNLYNTKIEMTLLNSSQSNAFVIPGNHLFIYSDIMEMITSEDMLFGLLGHEIAHLDLRHYERQTKHSGEELQKTLVMLGAGIAAALAGAGSDATTALWLGGIANQAENTLTYSRNQEQEADRRGREYLINAGLAPEGMTKLFQAFFKQALGRPKLEYLSSHPSPNSRLSDSFSTETKETILSNNTTTDFEFFRASMLAYRAGIEDKPFTYLDQNIQDNDAKNFAKGLFSYLIQSPERALIFLNKLEKHNQFTDYLQALSYAASGQTEQGLNIINMRLDLAPKDILFSMLHAQLTKTKPISVYSNYLYEQRLIWRANIQYYQSRNNIPMALNYRALLDFSQGKDKTAEYLIKRAENDAKDNDKNAIQETAAKFKIINEAEKQEDLEEENRN